MEDNRPTIAQYFVEQVCPDNKFLEEMDKVIPWWKIENWFNKEVVKNTSKSRTRIWHNEVCIWISTFKICWIRTSNGKI